MSEKEIDPGEIAVVSDALAELSDRPLPFTGEREGAARAAILALDRYRAEKCAAVSRAEYEEAVSKAYKYEREAETWRNRAGHVQGLLAEARSRIEMMTAVCAPQGGET